MFIEQYPIIREAITFDTVISLGGVCLMIYKHNYTQKIHIRVHYSGDDSEITIFFGDEGGVGGGVVPKNPDPSCRMDLDLWDCFGRETPICS